jgi:hypothetical protein
MSEEKIIQHGGVIGFRTGSAIFDVGALANTFKQGQPLTEDTNRSIEYVEWGKGNNYATALVSDGEQDTVIHPGIRFLSNLQYGGGVVYGKVTTTPDDGEESFEHYRDPVIQKFIKRNQLGKQIYTSMYDVNYFGWAVVLCAMSNDGRLITKYKSNISRAKNCRLGRKNKFGQIEKVFVNPDFGTTEYKAENSVSYSVVPEDDSLEWLQTKKPRTFAFVIQNIDTGRQYYPMPDWESARNSKWLNISKQIALFKSYILENQMTIKYHITVHPLYWPSRFGPAWEKMSPVEMKSAMEAELTSFNDFFKGAKGAGNTLMTSLGARDHLPQETWDHITINEIGSKFNKDGVYIEDSKEASQHKMAALGLHSELMGSVPGSTMGAGSGSGNRVAFNQRVGMAKPIQDFILWPLSVISEFNAWDETIEWRMRTSLITTLDTGAEATKPNATV